MPARWPTVRPVSRRKAAGSRSGPRQLRNATTPNSQLTPKRETRWEFIAKSGIAELWRCAIRPWPGRRPLPIVQIQVKSSLGVSAPSVAGRQPPLHAQVSPDIRGRPDGRCRRFSGCCADRAGGAGASASGGGSAPAIGDPLALWRVVPDWSSGQTAAGRLRTRRVPDRPLLREAGRLSGRRRADLPLLHGGQEPRQRAGLGSLGPLRRRDRADHRQRLQAALGDQFPRRPLGRDLRLRLRQRRDRQGHPLQHGGAPAGQDRGLRRLEGGRSVEDRRRAEEAGDPDRARLVHRSGAHQAGCRRRA